MALFDPLPSAEALRDEELLTLSIQNPAHFAHIVSRYEEPFLRKAERILGSRDEAYDVVQDTFTKIYLNARRFKPVPGASFKSWGYKILVNTAFTFYQKKKKDAPFSAKLDPELFDIIPDLAQLEWSEQELDRNLLVSVFSKMPRELSRVLELHFLEGRPHQEIARMESLSVPAVKTRVYRAKQLFRKIISSLNRV
ncbi:MAG: RNA polymerase sigma factor [Patescibacteria group bacterium]